MATPHSTLCKCADMQSSCLWFHSCLTFVISYWSCHSSTHVTEYCTVASPHCTEWCNELPDPFTLLRNGVWPYDTNFDHAAPQKDKRQDHSSTNILDLTSPLDSLVPGPRPKNQQSLFGVDESRSSIINYWILYHANLVVSFQDHLKMGMRVEDFS